MSRENHENEHKHCVQFKKNPAGDPFPEVGLQQRPAPFAESEAETAEGVLDDRSVGTRKVNVRPCGTEEIIDDSPFVFRQMCPRKLLPVQLQPVGRSRKL
ncbi:hypothetical protein SDC9_165816 [bioreactor metagenome]|uniref:Uncharacterized protein n=1 Tax=bioreactor metagenome TaxID=1076179 RepID=A0A645FX59_9ZZZZ